MLIAETNSITNFTCHLQFDPAGLKTPRAPRKVGLQVLGFCSKRPVAPPCGLFGLAYFGICLFWLHLRTKPDQMGWTRMEGKRDIYANHHYIISRRCCCLPKWTKLNEYQSWTNFTLLLLPLVCCCCCYYYYCLTWRPKWRKPTRRRRPLVSLELQTN